ncbi:guanylate-binding protein 7-like [Carlito syrichta]|uniref:Guanylate-binding protein 7-like n=1 Tax=Carlito syrichta TaxID=1868482 RepID=A0A1U7TIR1_CARSF|nr:guanylate-binding protein 7-like [Carlito syrichta]
MASESTMQAPICLVENEKEQLAVNPEALQILENISQPVVVVAITGIYRTGKSYLMNRLAGRNCGFPLGSTVRSKTKGIWMWCVPHPIKQNHTLVLLDTEGLGDVKKSDPKNDSWIFALSVLLSSAFVYNSMSTINHQALEQLHYVTELTQLIRAKASVTPGEGEDSTDFVSFFPDFVWTVRDFTLEMKIEECTITEDEYLEDALKLISGKNPKTPNSNMPRECIRHFFPKRKCFVFDRPTNDKSLLFSMEKVTEDQLDKNFQTQSAKFCSYIFTNAKTKTLRGGIVVTGSRLRTLVVTYVDVIKKGEVPCLENAVTTLAWLENSAAVQKAADHYSHQMAQRLRLPTDTLQELLDEHTACEKEAIAVFMERSFKDENQEFQKQLVVTIEIKKEDFLEQNERASLEYCQAELEKLSKPLMKTLSEGTFFASGGHKLYLEAKKKFEQDYNIVSRKGVKANEVLQNFLKSQATVEESILLSDKALTTEKKALEVVRAEKEKAEREREQLRQKEEEQKQKMKAQERSHQENIAHLREKFKKDQENFVIMLKSMLEHYLKVQDELLTEGFKKKAAELNAEINRLKKEIEAAKKNEQLSQKIEMAGKVLIAALPEIIKLASEGKKMLKN